MIEQGSNSPDELYLPSIYKTTKVVSASSSSVVNEPPAFDRVDSVDQSDDELQRKILALLHCYKYGKVAMLASKTMWSTEGVPESEEIMALIEKDRAERIKRSEGIGSYIAVSQLLRYIGYLLEHRRQGGLPEMTAQVIGEMYTEMKQIMAANDKYMRPVVGGEQPHE